jgi:acetoin utilization deacetylase AcuC-like enzyme
MFYRDPQVLYISTHQYPFYPGTGAATQIGDKEGRGFTVNVPMDAGCDDADFQAVHRAIVEPVLESFSPQLTLVSAGYDAHEQDPLASMRMTTAGYAAIVANLRRIAERHGAIALVTEGGYDLPALGACLESSLTELVRVREDSGEQVEVNRPDADPLPHHSPHHSPRAEAAIARALTAVRPYWPSL